MVNRFCCLILQSHSTRNAGIFIEHPQHQECPLQAIEGVVEKAWT